VGVSRVKRISFYIIKILSGIFLGYLVSEFTDFIDISWMLISSFLVMSPEGGDAMDLALTRIQSNLVGAGTGFLFVLMDLSLIMSIALGAVIALIICELLKLAVGSRAALAAVVIVLMNRGSEHIWDVSVHRVTSVVVGCLIGLSVTWFYHSMLKISTPALPTDGNREREA
jgi:uncharacterized membrane protein YgaE (UPF0421/DUF939 family)